MKALYKSINALIFSFKNIATSTWQNKKLENGEAIIPFFQPIICCSSGNLLGVEIFARLRDSKKSQVYLPSKLINNNTSLNTFNHITEELLKRTLMAISSGQFKIIDECFINLNISPKQIGDSSLIFMLSSYAETLSSYGYKLNVEITETHEITDYKTANAFINSLSKLGIDTYLDDYGKGFSSPLLLKHLSIKGLKIDKGFVKDIDTCPFSEDFILQTVRLAKYKGLIVIVEGIETVTQHQIISGLGVDFTQGYLHGKPAPLHFIDDKYSRHLKPKTKIEPKHNSSYAKNF